MCLRQLHGADNLGVGRASGARNCRHRSEVLVALHIEISTPAHHDSVSQNLPEILDAKKQNQPDLQASFTMRLLINLI